MRVVQKRDTGNYVNEQSTKLTRKTSGVIKLNHRRQGHTHTQRYVMRRRRRGRWRKKVAGGEVCWHKHRSEGHLTMWVWHRRQWRHIWHRQGRGETCEVGKGRTRISPAMSWPLTQGALLPPPTQQKSSWIQDLVFRYCGWWNLLPSVGVSCRDWVTFIKMDGRRPVCHQGDVPHQSWPSSLSGLFISAAEMDLPQQTTL